MQNLSEKLALSKLPMNIIVAIDSRRGIGKNGDLPWHIPEDLEYFYTKTLETADPTKRNAVLMGRKVWESLPAEWCPLKDRVNVVLSSTMKQPVDRSCVVARSFDDALSILNRLGDSIETIWNIGGNQPYQEALNSDQLCKLYVTFIEGDFDADTFFPDVDFEKFQRNDNSTTGKEHTYDGTKYRFEVFSVLRQ
ncbi:unnamed protein product [Anisakis simplex]|uniref:dihydrofolate reductase n=1 Tax=Anisakis simplex TaxID=6269 RepID=A0A0M3JST3_ANISI|nr:unnamed protein product [Anisakis simplex]